ncbi:MAG: ABC transporter substrate-binding protein [Chloroflexi bacterium]|nr:MAG: ABC transporter substrate-binding protein [Chloroflexota bacterium]
MTRLTCHRSPRPSEHLCGLTHPCQGHMFRSGDVRNPMRGSAMGSPDSRRRATSGLSRRRFVQTLGAGVVLGVAAPTLLAPVGSAAPASNAAAAAPGTLVIGLVAEPTSLDPGQLTDINSMKLLGAMYDTLVRFKPDSFDLAPSLATSWDISSDLMLYTFKLRPGVKFHDGTDFSADAVKFTYDRLLDPNGPYADTGPFPFAPGYYGSIAETIVVDPLTVQFRLNRQDASLINAFTLNTGRIVSPQAVKTSRKNFAQNPVGTGPFKFVSWDHNVRITLTANPDYWDGAPALSQLILSGGVDVIFDVPPDNIGQVKGNPDAVFLEQPGPHVWWVTLNVQKPPFDNVLVRHAVNYAVNKDALTQDILKGTGTPSVGPIPPAIGWAYTDQVTQYNYDPDRAQELLKQSGVLMPINVTFWVTESGSGMQSPKTMGTAIQADLAAIGVNAQIQTFEWGAFLNRYGSGLGDEASMAELSWMFDSGDPAHMLPNNLYGPACSPKGFNGGCYQNSNVDLLMNAALKINEREQRGAVYRQIQQIVADDAPWIFVDNQIQNAATSTRVSGLKLHPSFYMTYLNQLSAS